MAGGAYIKIKNGNIYLHAPGKIEHKGASHPFSGPTSLGKEMPDFVASESMLYSEKLDLKNFLIDNDHLSPSKAVVFKDRTEEIIEEFQLTGNESKRIYRENPEDSYKIAVKFSENFDIAEDYIEVEPTDFNEIKDPFVHRGG